MQYDAMVRAYGWVREQAGIHLANGMEIKAEAYYTVAEDPEDQLLEGGQA